MTDRHACLTILRILPVPAALLAGVCWVGVGCWLEPSSCRGGDLSFVIPAADVRSDHLGSHDDPFAIHRSPEIRLRPVQNVEGFVELRILVADSRREGPSLLADAPEPRTETPGNPPMEREAVLALPSGSAGAEEPIRLRLLDGFGQTGSVPTKAPSQPPAFLPPTGKGVTRSDDLEQVVRNADVHTRRAFWLVGRRAYFFAKAEFIAALRVLAQGLDREYRTNTHSRALSNGLTALNESSDFIPHKGQMESDLDVQRIAKSHKTPALRGGKPSKLMPGSALECYLTYAREQLAAAAGGEVAASMVLRGLGELQERMAEGNAQEIAVARPKAVVFIQAALLTFPQNHQAWNDLGVLLAGNGRFEEARLALEKSVSLSQHPAAWQNLAVVYQRLGDSQLADQAYRQSQALLQASDRRTRNLSPFLPVEWLNRQS